MLSMRKAGFTAAVPMYAASGLLTYGASEDMEHIIATLQAAGLCSEVLYKELYIPKAELDGAPRLGSEHLCVKRGSHMDGVSCTAKFMIEQTVDYKHWVDFYQLDLRHMVEALRHCPGMPDSIGNAVQP